MNQVVLFALHKLSCLRLEEKLFLLEKYPDENAFAGLTRFEAEWVLGRKLACRSFNTGKMLKQAAIDQENTEKAGIAYASFKDANYPSLLKEIYDPPLLLFWKGSLPGQNRESLAVVGTRKPSLAAEKSAFILGLDAGRSGIPVISGMAAGVDGAAHNGAISIKGRTWAVLGTGCDVPYPEIHRKMAENILNTGGGLISEFFAGTGPCRYNFPKRNRIISGLSTHIVVVQAPRRSGALYTADYALEQGREVLVHRSGLEGPRSEGSAALADQGARVVRAVSDFIPRASFFPVTGRKWFWDTSGEVKEGNRPVRQMVRSFDAFTGSAYGKGASYYG